MKPPKGVKLLSVEEVAVGEEQGREKGVEREGKMTIGEDGWTVSLVSEYSCVVHTCFIRPTSRQLRRHGFRHL